ALGVSYEKLGTAAGRRGDSESARRHYARALEYIRPLAKEDPDNLSLQANLALLLARAGTHAEASASALQMLRLSPKYANNLYNVGCCYSLCAAGVGRGQEPSKLSPQDATVRKQYAEMALKALDEAIKQGFSNLNLMRTDADLEAIRSEP